MDEFSVVDEKKFHKLDPKKKPLHIGIAASFAFVILPVLSYLYYKTALNRPAQTDKEITFRIEKGEGASSISDRLYSLGLVNSKALFDIYVVLNKRQSNIQAGTYVIPAGCNVKQLVELFQKGKDDVKITFLEGWRVEQVAQEAVSRVEDMGYESFVNKAKQYEGKLFPDTYEFNVNANEDTIINAMRENFNDKTEEVLADDKLAAVGLSVDQALVLASIVEREVITEQDRKIVAGILIARFKDGTTLDADATTQYVVAPKVEDGEEKWWPKQLTAEDLESTSPFNTRKVTGLPPTPICNPSLNAIKAVMEYQTTDYYYYLTDSEGKTHYAKTLDEHNKNVFNYLNR